MNKDELSELKIIHRAEAIHTPPLVQESRREKEVIAVIYLFICFTGGRIFFFNLCTFE